MARDRNQLENGKRDGSPEIIQPGHSGLGGSLGTHGDSGRIGAMGNEGGRERPAQESHGGNDSATGAVPIASLEGLFTGGFVAPLHDQQAAERWPTLQICMRACLTKEGQPRAGGEVKTVAAGPSYVTSLTMPEEGRMLRVAHDGLSNAWDALEAALMTFPIPWVQCSDYARRRAKIKQKKENKNLLDPSEKR